MSEFKNVTVVKEANVYFDGRVTSRTVLFPDGSKKTLGIMLPGEYTFSTGDKEVMEILAGALEVQLPGAKAWKKIKAGAVRSPAPVQVQPQGHRRNGLLLLVHQIESAAPCAIPGDVFSLVQVPRRATKPTHVGWPGRTCLSEDSSRGPSGRWAPTNDPRLRGVRSFLRSEELSMPPVASPNRWPPWSRPPDVNAPLVDASSCCLLLSMRRSSS